MKTKILSALGLVGLCAASAGAHDGRRFEIQILNNQLFAQGYVSSGIDDGGGLVRPYLNAVHGHWENDPSVGVQGAAADLPGFDLFDAGPLQGHSLTISVTGAFKWVNPPMMPVPGTVPDFQPLGAGKTIYVSYDGEFVSTDDPGPLTFSTAVPFDGLADIDLSYEIVDEPSGVIYVLECVLGTDAPGVAPSGTVYVILNPDPTSASGGMHHAALYTEAWLGSVPAPACPGDVNHDGFTNSADFNILAGHFGQSVPANTNGDLDGNGVVNSADFNILAGAFGCAP